MPVGVCACVGGTPGVQVYGAVQECSLLCLLSFSVVGASESIHSLLRNLAKYKLCPRGISGCISKWDYIKLSIQQQHSGKSYLCDK